MLNMKATIDVPDELYRRVKAKSAMRGQAVREVVVGLFQGWLAEEGLESEQGERRPAGKTPAWFGVARKYAVRANQHDMDAVRNSIAKGRGREVHSKAASKRGGL